MVNVQRCWLIVGKCFRWQTA